MEMIKIFAYCIKWLPPLNPEDDTAHNLNAPDAALKRPSPAERLELAG
jgi:hypothetical protein